VVARSLLSVADLSNDEIVEVLDLAVAFRWVTISSLLRGRTVVNLFYEHSTRTRISFELAAKHLGAEVVNFSVADSAEAKGESLRDTALTLEAMGVDALVVRHSADGVPYQTAQWTNLSVVNAGDGTNEHPTQALLDLLTIRERLGRLDVNVAIIGDVGHSRVARSLTRALYRMGAQTTLIGPPEMVPEFTASWGGATVSHDLESVLPDLDVCYVLRVQRERGATAGSDYRKEYGITRGRAAKLPAEAVVMHPGPMNRGVEIDSDVADSPRSVIREQVANGVPVRMAVLYELLAGE